MPVVWWVRFESRLYRERLLLAAGVLGVLAVTCVLFYRFVLGVARKRKAYLSLFRVRKASSPSSPHKDKAV